MKYKTYGILWLGIGILSQLGLPFAVLAAYSERGYFAIGGEWILLILSVFAVIFGIDYLTRGYEEERFEQSKRHRKSLKRCINNLLNKRR